MRLEEKIRIADVREIDSDINEWKEELRENLQTLARTKMTLSEIKEKIDEEFKKRNELESRIDQEISRIADPNNKKISEIRMKIIVMGETREITLLTELTDKVNTTAYFEADFESVDYYDGKKRIIKQGHVPKRLYQWLWKSLESNKVWELGDAYAQTVIGEIPHFRISVTKEDKRHSFHVAPYLDKNLLNYTKIINRISWFSHFAYSRVKNVQPILNEISREEMKSHHRSMILIRQKDYS